MTPRQTVSFFSDATYKSTLNEDASCHPQYGTAAQESPQDHTHTLHHLRKGDQVVQHLVSGTFKSQSGVRYQATDAVKSYREKATLRDSLTKV